MSVYVDGERNRFGRMVMCHMLADTLEELHAMADAIGLKRAWFQPKTTAPHYDLSLSYRARAVKAGALEIDRRNMGELIRCWRAASLHHSITPLPPGASQAPPARRASPPRPCSS